MWVFCCGCVVVEHVGVWVPTVTEQRFVDLYRKSAGGSTGEVLARMRANGKNILNDAHIPVDEKKKPGRKPKTATAGGSGGQKPPGKKYLSASGGEPRRHEVQYSGDLGGKGSPKPPSVEELTPFLAPASDKWAAFSDGEDVRTAAWLKKNLEVELWSLYRRKGNREKTPEALLEDLSASVELKTATSQASVVAQCRAARHQSKRIVIWASNVDSHDIQRAMGSVLSQYGADLESVTIIFNDGSEYVYWRHEQD